MCMVTLIGCNKMKFDQTTNKNDLLTEKYSISKITELKNRAEGGNMKFSDFKKVFDVQCVRKTHQGYYVVLLLDDGGNAFAFFDEDNLLNRVIVSHRFKSKVEFQSQVIEQMPKSEVLYFDPNAVFIPVSAVEMTAHIVQEGVFIVKYSNLSDYQILDDPVVTSIQFVDNASLSTNEDLIIKNEIPFIFELDKTSP